MTREITYKFDIDKDGKVAKIHNKRLFDQDLKMFAGKSIKVKLSRWTKQRSLPQLRYYMGCLIPQIIDGLVDNGYPRSELSTTLVHELLKSKFLKDEIVSTETGEALSVIRSTSDLTTTDMMNYIDDIVKWAAEFLNISVVLPNEQAMMDFE